MKKRIGVEGFRAIEEWLRHGAQFESDEFHSAVPKTLSKPKS